jgi:serine/threonine-protein kinase
MVRVGQRLGKYRLKRRLDRGGFADVFEAYDTLEGIHVALKVPIPDKMEPGVLADFRREIQIASRLSHPQILSVKNAEIIDGLLTIAYPLGRCSLEDRLRYRLSVRSALHYAGQMLEALAHAHAHHIIHCDVKPENLILFPDDQLRLGDFGLAKLSVRTLHASSSGTLGYMAPEQAMGRPSARSDVFSAGLILYRMLTGVLPDWPYEWPTEGYERLRRRAPDLVDVVRRSLQLPTRKRYRDAQRMLDAFRVAQAATRKRLDRKSRRARRR